MAGVRTSRIDLKRLSLFPQVVFIAALNLLPACAGPGTESTNWNGWHVPSVEKSARLPYLVGATVPSTFRINVANDPVLLEWVCADETLLAGYEQVSTNGLNYELDDAGRIRPYIPRAAVVISGLIETDYDRRIWTVRPWLVETPGTGPVTQEKRCHIGCPNEPGIWTLRIESAPTPEQGGLVTRTYTYTPAFAVGTLEAGPPGETVYREYTVEVVE